MSKFALVAHGFAAKKLEADRVLSDAVNADPFIMEKFDTYPEAKNAVSKTIGTWAPMHGYGRYGTYMDITVFAVYALDENGEIDWEQDPLALSDHLYAKMDCPEYMDRWMSYSDRDLLEEIDTDIAKEEIAKSIAFLNDSWFEWDQIFMPPHDMTAADFRDCWNYMTH